MTFRNTALLALCCLISVPAFASAKIAELNGVSSTIEQVTLLDDGTLNVFPRNNDKMKPVTMQISQANLDTALSLAALLSTDSIITVHRAAVCMLEIRDGGERSLSVGQYDSISQRFVGDDSHVVLTSDGCWNLIYTRPVDAAGLADSQTLETMLLTLANEALAQ